jgi:Putative prokaryotic signal transducing protein
MFGNHPADDWRALTEHYRSMADEELLELAADFNDLTPTAQQILRDELKLRKLPDPQAPGAQRAFAERMGSQPSNAPGSIGEGTDTESDLPIEYTWKTPLCDCEGDAQAWQISEVLRRAGIESWIEGGGTYAHSSGSRHTSVDEGNRRVVVAADQLDEARAIIAQPIPQDIIEQSKEEPDDDYYQPPVCPKCGTADPVLESADPVNAWKCEVCGAEWTDTAADPADPAVNDVV